VHGAHLQPTVPTAADDVFIIRDDTPDSVDDEIIVYVFLNRSFIKCLQWVFNVHRVYNAAPVLVHTTQGSFGSKVRYW
jgi:hypothetical protein